MPHKDESPSRNNAVTNALGAVYTQMFPGGKEEERILTDNLYRELNRKFQLKTVNQILCCVLSSIILICVTNEEQIRQILNKRFNIPFDSKETDRILQFALSNNKMAALLFEAKNK